MTEAEKTKPRHLYIEEAIQAALESQWEKALETNRELLELYGPDENTYNRLGKAYTELGNLPNALEAYSSALEINAMNTISQKNVRKLTALLETRENVSSSTGAIDVDLFTEEPGKSGLAVLHPTGEGVSAAVAPGDNVELEKQDSSLFAKTGRGVVLGEVDAKLARRLLPLMATGNQYSAAVAHVEEEKIEIMIRETFQSTENTRKSSFPITRREKEFRPYAKDSLLATREIGIELLNQGENESVDILEIEDEGGDELEGMRTLDGDFDDDTIAVDVDEEDAGTANSDQRPEDEY